MGDLIRHGLPCTECTSSDAMAEYSTNFFCYSCKAWVAKKKKEGVESTKVAKVIVPNYEPMSDKAERWLSSYGITPKECELYKIKYTNNFWVWSARTNKRINMGPRVVFQYGDEESDLEARSLRPNDKIKYITVGNKTNLFRTFDKSQATMVITEDILSAIKVGRQCPAVALRGTACNQRQKEVILELCTNEIIIWLDSDEAGQVAAEKLTSLFEMDRKVSWVVSPRDPKYYTNRIIKELLEKRQ